MVAAGAQHSLVVLEDGSVIGFGHNGWGRARSRWPPELGGRAVAVAGGSHHSLALLQSGRVVGWGQNVRGEADSQDFGHRGGALAIAAGVCHSLALLADGTVAGWGSNDHGCAEPPNFGGRRVLQIAAGAVHSLALLEDHTITGWGSNQHGAAAPPPLNDVVAIAAGNFSSLAVRRSGEVVVWGALSDDPSAEGAGSAPTQVAAAAVGHRHTVYLHADGSVTCSGDNSKGQAAPPRLNKRAIAVSAGDNHSLALLCDGRVVAWGDNEHGQTSVPDLSGLRACAVDIGVVINQWRGLALLLMWQCRLQRAAHRLRKGGAGEPLRALPPELWDQLCAWSVRHLSDSPMARHRGSCAVM
eukprot:TRINITY_DN4956_c1_g1_i1.p1 TRINITY_DN4956_c1_g1~~TRINITY_DN4956_c1_g1_i1.p1  ORF type:complete len:399 (+),score=96.16 TRINITY_DN4956_c1_g1_i1:132-1199(+)